MNALSRGVAALAALALSVGCVVSTFEGPGEPPRVGVSPVSSSSRTTSVTTPESSEAIQGQPTEMAARHLLVSYQGALRASPSVIRTKQEAEARCKAALVRARAGEDFDALVKEFSDEPGAAERGGSLGRFQRGMMVPAFEKAAFKLAPGEVSEIVETQFGFHVIQRTE